MKCPKCGSCKTFVIDSRNGSENTRRRRYSCSNCDSRFSTIEEITQIKRIEVNCPACKSGATNCTQTHIRPDGVKRRSFVCFCCGLSFSKIEADLEHFQALTQFNAKINSIMERK